MFAVPASRQSSLGRCAGASDGAQRCRHDRSDVERLSITFRSSLSRGMAFRSNSHTSSTRSTWHPASATACSCSPVHRTSTSTRATLVGARARRLGLSLPHPHARRRRQRAAGHGHRVGGDSLTPSRRIPRLSAGRLSQSPGSGSSGRKSRTGHVASCSTRAATLPRASRAKPVRAWVVMAMRPA